MAAFNKNFPWLSHYGHYRFFESQLRLHSKISKFEKIQDGLYKIAIKGGRELKIFICECYSFGVAEYYEVVEKLGEVDAIVINSNWCGYSPDAKQHCRELSIGVFKIGEFMGAVNLQRFWEYIAPDER